MILCNGGQKRENAPEPWSGAAEASTPHGAEERKRWMEEEDLREQAGPEMRRRSDRYRGVRL